MVALNGEPSGPVAPVSSRRASRQSMPHSNTTSGDLMAPPALGQALRRTLRTRPSDPGPAHKTRELTADEAARVRAKLGDEGVAARRAEVVAQKEEELKAVVDAYDTAVRERFHLERYVSLIDAWDPVKLKADNSPVFTEWRDTRYNLLSLLPSAEAGPSRRGAARTTRRQAHEQNDALLSSIPTSAPPLANGHAKPTTSVKGKSKAVEPSEPPKLFATLKEAAAYAASLEAEVQDTHTPVKKGRGKELSVKAKDKGRRTTMDAPPRPTKKLKLALVDSPSASPAPASSPQIRESTFAPTPPPVTPLPSLAHLEFPPPPIRQRERRTAKPVITYTDPTQMPTLEPKFGGDIDAFLASYIHIDDAEPAVDIPALELRAAREAFFRNRVNYLQQQGRLLRLLDEDDADAAGAAAKTASTAPSRKPAAPARLTDHHDALLSHAQQVRNAIVVEAKYKPQACRRIARMVMQYWEHEQGKEERARVNEERERKKRAKDVVRAIRKKWGMAVKVIRAQKLAAQKLEQDRRGKEHLQNMLQRSTGLLEAQREDIAGRDGGESDGTDDVDVAEDSQEEQEEEEDMEEGKTDEQEQGEGARAGLEAEEDVEDGAIDIDQSVADGGTSDDGDDDASDGDSGSDNDAEPSVDLRLLLTDGDTLDFDGDAAPSSVVDVSDIAADVALDAAEDTGIAPVDIDVVIDGAGMAAVKVEKATALSINGDGDAAGLSPVHTDARPAQQPSPLANNLDAEQGTNQLEIDEVSGPTPSSLPIPAPRSRRARQPKPTVVVAARDELDAQDGSFSDDAEAKDQDAQDEQMDVDMEAEDEGRDSEDQGLLDDADVPIEELLRRYGYPVPAESAGVDDAGAAEHVAAVAADSQPEGDAPIGVSADTPCTNGNTTVVNADQMLTDASIEARRQSPSLIVEGKRQRKVRTVWSPVDNTPAPPKKPKIEVVESTPELSDDESDESDEISEDDDHDEVEVEAEHDDLNGFKIRPPFLLRGTLRPYQHAGLEWLASLYANNMNGILADEMGLGKTIQTISLLAHLACDRGVWGQHLIIVPTSVILNWEMEFKKFLPGFKVLTYYGNQKERKDKRVGWHTENAWQVCITSYQIVLADQHIFRRKNWEYMILDEAHNIKNFRSQRWQTLLGFKAQRRLLLTGTPLQNNLMELWSLLYFLMPNGVTEDATSVVGFANHKEFTEWFSNPMDKAVESGEAIDDDMRETVGKLHTLLRPFILRRLKSEVETQLPGKFEHVVYCKLSKRQRFLYDEFMSRASTKEALTSGGYLGVVNTLMQLRKVCNHPDLFEVRPVRTSFAMDPVAEDFGPAERVVRRLLGETEVVGDALRQVTANEGESGWAAMSRAQLDASDRLPQVDPKARPEPKLDTRTVAGWKRYRAWAERQASLCRWRSLAATNRARCHRGPIYGTTTLAMLGDLPRLLLPLEADRRSSDLFAREHDPPVAQLVLSHEARARKVGDLIETFAIIPPNAVARDLSRYALPGLSPTTALPLLDPEFDTLHHPAVKLQIAFPDASLLQYDCGKLQKLDEMLRTLKADGHRVLIFTQMTRVLDILETFLSYNGHRYLRLDGSTKIEDRQVITERFNSDARIFCFIASSRSGGVGINLTGADTVFFYDSDWNPSMDRQCMDRAHRIGQTREVHIYRFVSMHTVEENMLKKANQKRLLDRVVIQEGDFTTDFFGKMDWRDMLDHSGGADDVPDANGGGRSGGGARIEDVDVEGTPFAVEAETTAPRVGQERELARALAQVEDEEDAEAARVAQGEGELDLAEFVDGGKKVAPAPAGAAPSGSGTPLASKDKSETPAVREADEEEADGKGEEEEEEEEDDVGAVDEYMLRLVEWDWDYFVGF
ncbi:swr1 complex component [Cryptotrichosporon argae]